MIAMRRLILLRHAKSALAEAGQSDFDRPLNQRGLVVTPKMGDYMQNSGLLPDYALISSSRRTRDTWQHLQTSWPETRHGFDGRLYEASLATLMGIIRAMPTQIATLLVIAHNPGLHELAISLQRQDNSKMARLLREKFPTAALCVLDFSAEEWSDVWPQSGFLERFETPRHLGFGLSES